MQRLTGKAAVVLGVGARENIGQAIARRLAAEGAKVVIAGRDRSALEPLADEIGGRAAACDIADQASLEALFSGPAEPFDIAINCAGRNLFRPFLETTAEDVDSLCRVHVTGPILFTQAAVKAMPRGGSIIHISSLTARMVMLNHVAYMATKAAGEMVIRAAAFEFGGRNIRVNGIAPALTRTPMTEEFFANEELVAASARTAPLHRLGTVADIAAAAVWLAGDECFVTGEILQVNGGMAIHALSP